MATGLPDFGGQWWWLGGGRRHLGHAERRHVHQAIATSEQA
jgi:hypothetical protein